MKVLVVHYHLKPGGVTTVIRRQLSVLATMGVDAAVLAGEVPGGFGGSVSVEPALAYDSAYSAGSHPGNDADRVAAIVSSIGRAADALGEDTIIHVHNPTIRKNSSLLPALSELASKGRRLVLHVHDLAEDWRPDVYSKEAYPDGVLWVAINRFDVESLRTAGAGSVVYLPNAVPCPPELMRSASEGSMAKGPGLVLCPVRGIRRKNLGEAVLLSMFMRDGSRLGVTLPPTSPRDMPFYQGWRDTAARKWLPIAFGLGLDRTLDELYAESIAVVSTSIKEGFGMSFMEPATKGRVTLGRRLSVVSDFEQDGLNFPALYDAIVIPRGLFDESTFRERVDAVVAKALMAYGLPIEDFSEAIVASVLDARGAGPDFGRLDEPAQAQVLDSLGATSAARRDVLNANPFLDAWDKAAQDLEPPRDDELEPWSEAVYGTRLKDLYASALQDGGGAAPDKDRLLELYLRPEAFHGVGI